MSKNKFAVLDDDSLLKKYRDNAFKIAIIERESFIYSKNESDKLFDELEKIEKEILKRLKQRKEEK